MSHQQRQPTRPAKFDPKRTAELMREAATVRCWEIALLLSEGQPVGTLALELCALQAEAAEIER